MPKASKNKAEAVPSVPLSSAVLKKFVPEEHLTKGNVIAVDETMNGAAEIFWEVETMMGKRKRGRCVEYLVKWKVSS